MPARQENSSLRWLSLAAILIPPSLVTAQEGAGESDLGAHRRDLAAVEAGFAHLERMRYEDAQLVFEEHLARFPASESARVGLARVARRPASRAVALRRQIEEIEPDSATPAELAGKLEFVLRGLPVGSDPRGARMEEEARDLLAALEEKSPGSIWATFARARLAERQGMPRHLHLKFTYTTRRRWRLVENELAPEWSPAPEAVAALRPLLEAERATLLFWNYYLSTLSRCGDEDLMAARRAVASDASSPLAPAVLLECAAWTRDPQSRWNQLLEIETRYAASPFWARARLDRAMLIDGPALRRREAIELLEELVERGEELRAAHGRLAGLYLESDRPRDALTSLRWLEANGGGEWHRSFAECLTALGDLDGAGKRLRRWIDEIGPPGESHFVARTRARAQVLLADNLVARKRHREALDLYEAAARSGGAPGFLPLPLRPAFLRALVGSYPLPLLASAILPALGMICGALALIIFFVYFSRIRIFLPASLALALLVTLLQGLYCVRHQGFTGMALTSYLAAAFLRNFLLASAGAVLLERAGVRQGPLFLQRRLPAASPRRRAVATTLAIDFAVALLLMVGWTVFLFRTWEPEPGEFFQRMAVLYRGSEYSLLLGEGDLPGAGLLVTVAAIHEEVLFRFFLLGLLLLTLRRLSRRKRGDPPWRGAAAVAILATSLLWALPHAGMVHPEWWKMVQVTGLGIVLGSLALRRGAGAAILAHVLFNLGALVYA